MADKTPFQTPPYSFRHRLNCAYKGTMLAFTEGRHMRFHLLAFILVIIAALFFRVSKSEWLALLLVSGLVICLELVNSSVEKAMDTLHPQFDEGIGKAKDILAGAVLMAAIFAVMVGGFVFIPSIFQLIKT